MDKNTIIIQNYSNEIQVIIHILKNFGHQPDNGNAYFLPEINEGKFIETCELHRITPFIYKFFSGTDEFADTPLLQKLKTLTLKHIYRNLNFLNELLKICNSFQSNKVNYMVVKGPQLSHFLYGDATLRVSADLDFFLRGPDELKKASELLISLGYDRTNFPEKRSSLVKKFYLHGKNECFFFNRDLLVSVDLHIRPVSNTFFYKTDFLKLFENSFDYMLKGKIIKTLCAESYLLFLCYHGTVHAFSKLHWLNDTRVFISAIPYDEEKLLRLAGEFQLLRNVKLAFTVLNILFNSPGSDVFKLKEGILSEFLIHTCIKNYNRKLTYGNSLRGRFRKTLYLFFLAESFRKKSDLILSIIFRYIYRWIFK